MATITLSIPDKDIKTALAKAAEDMGYTLKPGFKAQDIVDELAEDVLIYVTNDLQQFFEGGIEADCYTDSLHNDDDE